MVRFFKNTNDKNCQLSIAQGDCCCNCKNFCIMVDDKIGYVGTVCRLGGFGEKGETVLTRVHHAICEMHKRVRNDNNKIINEEMFNF